MVVPLISRTKGDLGSLVIVRSVKVSNTEKELLQHIAETFSHALDSFLFEIDFPFIAEFFQVG